MAGWKMNNPDQIATELSRFINKTTDDFLLKSVKWYNQKLYLQIMDGDPKNLRRIVEYHGLHIRQLIGKLGCELWDRDKFISGVDISFNKDFEHGKVDCVANPYLDESRLSVLDR